MGKGDLSRVAVAAVRYGKPALFRDKTVWGSWKCPVGIGPAGSVFGHQFVLSRSLGYKTTESPYG